MEKFITAAGCALRVADNGRGDCTLVLLHGYLESLDVWDDFTPLLSPFMRVVAPDLPGHGISEVKGPVHSMEFLADTLAGVLDTLGIDRAVIAGHSMGGYAAQAFAVRYPERSAGLILVHSTPDPDSEAKRADRDREIALIRSGKKELLSRVVPGRGFAPANRRRLHEAIEALAEQVTLTEDEGIVALLRGMQQRPDLNEALRRIDVPQLFIFGSDDEYIPLEKARAVVTAHPQARTLWLEHSGHMGFVEEPEATARAILDFCRTVCPERFPALPDPETDAP